MFEMLFPYIFQGIMCFMSIGLSFRALVVPAIAKSRLERDFIKRELLLLRESHTKLKQDFYDYRSETSINLSELAQNDSIISKRQELFDNKIDMVLSTNQNIDNHFIQMIELFKNK